jgi:trans-aconitate methyltransferase
MSLPSKQVVQDVSCLLNHYPWEKKHTIVDLGGSLGSVSIQLAEKFPHLKCTVQDLPDVAEEGKLRLPHLS